MTEKEKMLNHEIYNANYDEELIKERTNCKDLCFEYNNTLPSKIDKKEKLIKKILGETKEKVWIEAPFYCDYGYNTKVGENFYANHGLILLDAGSITFGDNVFIGPSCEFYTSHHSIIKEERNKGLEYADPIIVGNDVWFGGKVVVLPGITIGDNVIVGAGSVITKDIPSNSIAVGNPARVIKTIENGKVYPYHKTTKL